MNTEEIARQFGNTGLIFDDAIANHTDAKLLQEEVQVLSDALERFAIAYLALSMYGLAPVQIGDQKILEDVTDIMVDLKKSINNPDGFTIKAENVKDVADQIRNYQIQYVYYYAFIQFPECFKFIVDLSTGNVHGD